ncbi:transcription factor HIVEP3 isoform X1 [Palaemon carinicauda]|uniref:transcription factor HIVEP3 isoform X1 n=1 Tax=Palaemon carinicauda TaxID=392227 RepID=UPI0035B59DC8
MGVITCTAPMNPTGNVTYTHKKFKRAASEANDNAADQQKQQLQPKNVQPHERDIGKQEKTEVTEARPTSITPSSQSALNGHLPAQPDNCQVTSNVGGHLAPTDGDEVKRKTSGSVVGKYKCDYCGVFCAKPSVLDKHIRTHTNERPYSCDHCRIAFKTKSNYLKHTKSRAHVLKCDNSVPDGGEGLLEATDGADTNRIDVSMSPSEDNVSRLQFQQQPADLSVAKSSAKDSLPSGSVAPPTPKLHQEDLIKDRGKSLYKPKFRAQYSLQEDDVNKGQIPPLPPPPLPVGHQPAPSHDGSQTDCNTSNPVTYHQPPATPNTNSHPSQSRHPVSPAHFPKQCLPPLDIRAAATNKKEDSALSGQRSSGVTPSSANTLWKGMKSPSPELLEQHITKLIVENQAIVETHNPLWSRRYRRNSSFGSSSSESEGSGSGKMRRCSLIETPNKNSKINSVGTPVSYGLPQPHVRERSHSSTAEALMIEPRSSYSPSLPPNPHLPLAQSPVTLISASKPSISSHGLTTSYSQSDPAFATSHIVLHELDSTEGPRKRSIMDGSGVVRDPGKSRLHLKNPEGSVIKNLLLTAQAGIASTLDQNFERLEQSRIANQNSSASAEVGMYACTWCRTRCHSPESLEYHVRHCCGHRQGGSGSERGTPDSIKSGDGSRWSGEQDVALDLQKKDRSDIYDHERSSSRGSSISVGESSQRRGSDEDVKYRLDLSPRVYEAISDGASPPTKRRKMSDPETANHDKNVFLSPIFSPKGQVVGKMESSMKIMDEMGKPKGSSRHFFGGEVQICDGKNLKTMRIDPGQQPSPTLDICIPPHQLGGSIVRSEVSVPTSVVVTIAKSGLNSGGTMVQVESQISTSSTKTVPSLVNSLLPQEQSSVEDSVHHNKVKSLPHPTTMYPSDPARYPFSPFLQYAPLLQLPNLTIPGIPTPDLRDLPYPMNPPNAANQPFLHGQASHTQKQSSFQSPVVHSRISHLTLPPGTSHLGGTPLLHGNAPGITAVRSSLAGGTHGSGLNVPIRDKEKEHPRKSSYPTLIPVGNEKVPYVPGIPGPYSQAGSVVQSHSIQKSPLAVFTPPVPAPSLSPGTSKAHFASVPTPVPLLVSEGKEKHLPAPRIREISRDPSRTHLKESSLFVDSIVQSPKVMLQVPQKDMHGQTDRPVLSRTQIKSSEIKPVNPEIRIHPVISSPVIYQEKKDLEKKQSYSESHDCENSVEESASNSKDFLPSRKRPNSLALKPQPFMPKSDSLIGTTLVSPDTPRPKKSCVQMLLNGSAYTYLGHKVSTKSYFCCIYRQQPMYVPQSTDPKLSMYSNWQIKPAEDNPLELTPYQSLGLYQSRKYNHAYTIAREKELNLIQTHSSYWTFKEEKEKHREKEKADGNLKVEEKEAKAGSSQAKISEHIPTTETSGPSIKREPEDPNDDSSCKTDDGEGFDGSAKRIKIFEGGFKSTEEYTYVRGRGRGRYVCGACGIRCKKPSMLKKHIRTHTDLRPYACTHCSFSFKTKGNLTKHLRSKAHYKRCVEMGVVPVPTTVDDSHVNEEALALQGKMEQDRIDDEDDDDDDEDEDDDEDVDEEEEEDDMMDEDQFEDADILKEQEESNLYKEKLLTSVKELNDSKKPGAVPCVPPVSRAGVLVMLPSIIPQKATGEGKGTNVDNSADPSSRDSPIDLSVKKLAGPSSAVGHDKVLPLKKHAVPTRPNFLPIMSNSSVTDLRSPAGKLASPGTPLTPIREHPSEILSPVTESSSLLKSIYNTTLRISSVSSGERQNIVLDPTKENGCNSLMFQDYLKERAVLESNFKRQQYKNSSSDTSPDSPQSNLVQTSTEVKSSSAENETPELSKKSKVDAENKVKISGDECKKDGKEGTSQGSDVEQIRSSTPSSSSATFNSSLSQGLSRMPTPPANLTVMNSVGMDTKTAFLVPSGVVPSLSRLGNDDGKCKCSICHKEFNKQAQLSIHMNIHYMERPYRCDSCSVSFRTNGHLQKHKRSLSHYNKVNMNMTFGTPSTDNPRPFKCHDCKIAFRIHGHLAKHLRSKMHIMKLECLEKLPFGTYAEIERSGANLNEIDTTDCDNSLESLQSMATRLYEKEPTKLAAWQTSQKRLHHRVRTVSNSSTNSDDYPLQDEQDDPLSGCGNDEDTEGDEDEEVPIAHEPGSAKIPVMGPSASESYSPQSSTLPTIEIGSQQLTQPVVQPFTCGLCEAKFSSHSQLIIHSQQNCVVKSS